MVSIYLLQTIVGSVLDAQERPLFIKKEYKIYNYIYKACIIKVKIKKNRL